MPRRHPRYHAVITQCHHISKSLKETQVRIDLTERLRLIVYANFTYPDSAFSFYHLVCLWQRLLKGKSTIEFKNKSFYKIYHSLGNSHPPNFKKEKAIVTFLSN